MSSSGSSCGRSSRGVLDSDSRAESDVNDELNPAADHERFRHREPGTEDATTAQSPFMDVLDTITEFGPTVIDLNSLGDLTGPAGALEDRRETFTLGSGATAKVIRHVTDDDTTDIVDSGTSIALKIFSPADSTSSQSRREAMDSFRREIRALCDPAISRQPNIVKLLFVGFQTGMPYPILAMELGKYGSLEHVLTDSGMGPSPDQRLHIALDIAHGLRDLHQSGFIHGDLKPDNVLLFDQHKENRLTAKITDFGGSTRHSHGLPTRPMPHITELWCAPEVLNRDSDIDWRKADVYSYGLVVASLYARPTDLEVDERWPSCFLSMYTPRNLEASDLSQYIWILKASDSEGSGIANMARHCMSKVSPDFLAHLELVLPTLDRYFWDRPNISQVIDCIQNSPEFRRIHLIRSSHDSGLVQTQLRPREGLKRFKVWSPDLYGRSDTFRSYVLEQLCEDFGIPHRSPAQVLDIPADVGNMSPTEFLGTLWRTMTDLKSSCSANIDDPKRRQAFHIGVCHLMGLGTELDVQEGLKWLRESALRGFQLAIYHFPMFPDEDEESPIRLFLCLGALAGSHAALERLAKSWPSLFRMIRSIFKGRNWSYVAMDDAVKAFGAIPYFIGTLAYWLRESSHEAATSDSRECYRVEDILKMGSIDEALHSIRILSDHEAAPLARELFERGARLDCIRPARGATMGGIVTGAMHLSQPTLVSPLSGAIRIGQLKLADTLLNIHIEQEIPIPDMATALATSFGYWHVGIARRLLQVRRTSPDLCHNDPSLKRLYEHMTPNSLLRCAMADRALMHLLDLEKRAIHGSGYEVAYAQTLELLTSEGANLFQGGMAKDFHGEMGFSGGVPSNFVPRGITQVLEASSNSQSSSIGMINLSLQQNDLTAFAVFVQHLQKTPEDLVAWLANPMFPESSADGTGVNALQLCLHKESPTCFAFLLNKFPDLVNHQTRMGFTTLHLAAFEPKYAIFVEELLDHGADFTVCSKPNKLHATPIATALLAGNVMAAELISARCSETQLKSLLERSHEDGHSIFAQLFVQWVLKGRKPELLESFYWLMRLGGAHFFGVRRKKIGEEHVPDEPAWNVLLDTTCSSTRIDVLRDLELVQLLFDFFPDQVHKLHADGRSPLHAAVMKGHVEIVRELVLQRHANVNQGLEAGEAHSRLCTPGSMEGFTALDLLVLRERKMPQEVQRGGLVAEGRWRQDISTIAQLLISAGATHGPKADFSMVVRGLSFDPQLRIKVFQHSPLDARLVSSWPHKLPRDDSSREPHTSNDLEHLQRMKAMMSFISSLPGMIHDAEDGTFEFPDRGLIEHIRNQAHLVRSHWRKLPVGWDIDKTDDGRVYYVDHNTKTTTWQKPYQSSEPSST